MIIDVAHKAGVSKSTVSLVLQHSPSVRDDTRAQVRQAMADIGYVDNRAAANMRMANAGLIGLVINDLRNPFFTEFATALQMALSGRGYAVVIANTGEDPQLRGPDGRHNGRIWRIGLYHIARVWCGVGYV